MKSGQAERTLSFVFSSCRLCRGARTRECVCATMAAASPDESGLPLAEAWEVREGGKR